MSTSEVSETGRDGLAASALSYAWGILSGTSALPGGMTVPTGEGEDLSSPSGGGGSVGNLRHVFAALTLAREDALPRDGLGRPAEAAWAWDAGTPWVDHLADRCRPQLFSDPQPGRKAGFQVIVTHDIDHTTTLEPTLLLNSLLHQLGLRKHQTIPLRAALKPGHLLATLERVLDFEKEHQVRSILFMLAGPYGAGRYGSRTDCRWKSARGVIRMAKESGMEIGLHGSFYARDQHSYGTERQRLEDQVGRPVVHHRNHYLRFDGARLCSQLEAAGLQWDHSVGFARWAGFRSGTARPYRGFDRVAGRPSSVGISPMAFMDTAVEGKSVAEALAIVRNVLVKVREVQGCVSLNFHPEPLAASPQAGAIFRESVLLAKELGADLNGWVDKLEVCARAPGMPEKRNSALVHAPAQ